MDSDEQPFPILSPYSPHPSNHNRMNTHQQPLRDHVLHPAPRQYTTAPEFQDNYGNEPQPSMLQNTPRYRDSSCTIKEEHDLNTYIYSNPINFRREMDLNVHHHPTHPDHNSIRYPASHNPYSSDVNSSNTIRMASSPLESPDARLASGPAESSSADFRYQIRAFQPHQQHLLHQRHQHGPLPHHQHQNHSLNHLQGGSAFYSPPINYSQDQEHSSPSMGGLDHSQTQLSSLEYDSRESHVQHVPVPGMVYDSLAVPGHSQQGVVRCDTTMNSHHGSLASINSSSNSGSGGGSYHTSNSPVSSIPMSNNHGTTSSMNTSVLGAHISSPFSLGPSSNSRWAGHPSGFDMPGSTTAAHSQVPTPASSTSSLIRPTSFRHASEPDSRSTPESSFTQDNNNFHLRLRTSTSAQTLSSSHSHTNSPSPRLSDNESTSPGGGGGQHLGLGSSEMFNPDDRDGSDQDVETVIRMSEKISTTGRKAVVVIKAGEEVKKETLTPPVKKKKKSKMHCCEVCMKKFPRPSGLRTHMNTHSNERPYPCGFPGCSRSFGVRSNAKRHLRTHGVIPTPATNPNSSDAPYIVGFCPPMIGVPQSSSSHHQLHSIEGSGDKDFPPLPGGSSLPGDNAANIHHTQDHQGQSDVQQQQHEMMSSVVPLKLRWMPPSLTTRTNAGSLREVVDEQQQQMQHWMGGVVEEEEEDGEDDDDFAAGGNSTNISHVRRTSRGGYDMDQVDMVEDGGDKIEFGENVPRLRRSIPLCPVVIPSSSSTRPAVAASSSTGIRLTVSTQEMCRLSSSSSRIIASSISPSSTSSLVRSNSSLSPPSAMSGYGQQHEIDHNATNAGGGRDVFYTTRTEDISREYGV